MKLEDCLQPWFEMQLDYHQTIRPCCFYKEETDKFDFSSENNLNIKKIWNSSYFQNYRKIITGEEKDAQGCNNCEWVTGQKDVPSKIAKEKRWDDVKILNPKNEKIYRKKIENKELAKKEFFQKKIILESLPTKIYINFGNECNYKCTFCFQNPERDAGFNSTVSAEKLIQQKDIINKASSIHLIGGEPLVIKESRKFIDYIIEDKDFHDTQLALYTNGALLHRYIEKLSVFENLVVPVSMETAGRALEKLRVGSIWSKLEKNILGLKEFAKTNNKNWNVSIACTVMKTSLVDDGLYNLIKWCKKNNLGIHFGYINAVTEYDFEHEDFFKNPKMLKQQKLKNWKKMFEKCLNELQIHQDHYAYNVLNGIYNHALNCAKNYSYKKELVHNLDQYLRSNIVPIIPKVIRKKLRFVKKFGILNSPGLK